MDIDDIEMKVAVLESHRSEISRWGDIIASINQLHIPAATETQAILDHRDSFVEFASMLRKQDEEIDDLIGSTSRMIVKWYQDHIRPMNEALLEAERSIKRRIQEIARQINQE